MLRLEPTSSLSAINYELDVTSSRGPPIAEAGFSVTGLTPTFSTGSQVDTQSQNYVLLGGNTQNAFINMSQVAIWSLPEESWSFVTVQQPTVASNGNTELTVKSTVTSVDSRSGHSAVLTEDGSKIIVFGGWVGNVNQAADPQLAVLQLGAGFGGPGVWEWSIPVEQPSGDGIYGHGAVMLPGNVMMVLGGYNISTAANTKRSTSAAQALFFNATSMTWASDYTNPAYVAAIQSSAASSASASKSHSSHIGLGIGLGIGLPLFIASIVVLIWFLRRQRKKREDYREKDLNSLSIGHPQDLRSFDGPNIYPSPNRETKGIQSGGFPWSQGRWNNSGDQRQPLYDSTSAVDGYESLYSGPHNLGDSSHVTSPNRQIPRKPLRSAQGLYTPAPTFDFGMSGGHVRANSLGTAGPIHPIYEDDENLDVLSPIGVGVALPLGEDHSSSVPGPSNGKRHSDPFKDPPANFSAPLRRKSDQALGSPTAESPAQEREREIQSWVQDWAAADALLNIQARSHSTAGRLSPSRKVQLLTPSNPSSMSGEVTDDSSRTASNLSERSVAVSAMTLSRSGSSSQGTRSNSLRGFITQTMNPFHSTTHSGNTSASPVFDSLVVFGPPLNPKPGSSSSDATFKTARTSFPSLQLEGENLLPRPEEYSDPYPPSPTGESPDGSPSKSKPIQLGRARGQSGWLGSIRRAFTSESENTTPYTPLTPSFSPSPKGVDSDFSSGNMPPRRTVSAGATLWRRKQGKSDWEDSAENIYTKKKRSSMGLLGEGKGGKAEGDGLLMGGAGEDDDDDDWDIEKAIENRVVQVMFTVPKERLRVVNHDMDALMEGSEVGSLRSKKSTRSMMGSRKGSMRSARSISAGAASSSGGAGGTGSGSGGAVKVEGASILDGEELLDISAGDALGAPDVMKDKEKGKGQEKWKGKGKGKGKVSDLIGRLEGNSTGNLV